MSKQTRHGNNNGDVHKRIHGTSVEAVQRAIDTQIRSGERVKKSALIERVARQFGLDGTHPSQTETITWVLDHEIEVGRLSIDESHIVYRPRSQRVEGMKLRSSTPTFNALSQNRGLTYRGLRGSIDSPKRTTQVASRQPETKRRAKTSKSEGARKADPPSTINQRIQKAIATLVSQDIWPIGKAELVQRVTVLADGSDSDSTVNAEIEGYIAEMIRHGYLGCSSTHVWTRQVPSIAKRPKSSNLQSPKKQVTTKANSLKSSQTKSPSSQGFVNIKQTKTIKPPHDSARRKYEPRPKGKVKAAPSPWNTSSDETLDATIDAILDKHSGFIPLAGLYFNVAVHYNVEPSDKQMIRTVDACVARKIAAGQLTRLNGRIVSSKRPVR
jgi:hypothetical protein